jgi:hypothetical protein
MYSTIGCTGTVRLLALCTLSCVSVLSKLLYYSIELTITWNIPVFFPCMRLGVFLPTDAPPVPIFGSNKVNLV